MQTKTIIVNNKALDLFFVNEKSQKPYFYIFLNGINAQPIIIDYLKDKINDKATIITFNNIAHFNNLQKHTSNVNKYLSYTISVIKEIKKQPFVKDKKVVLIGESFGACLGLLATKKYPNLVDLCFVWNAPTKIAKNKNMEHQFSTSIKTLFTFLFNIETYTVGYFDPRLTSNKALIRLNQLQKPVLVSTKLNLVCWKMIPKIKKIIKDELNQNVYLVQSFEDILCDVNFFKKINNENNHIIIYKTGYHVLSAEENESKQLFRDLHKQIEVYKW